MLICYKREWNADECWMLTSKNSAKLKQYYFHAEFLEEIRYCHYEAHFRYEAYNMGMTHYYRYHWIKCYCSIVFSKHSLGVYILFLLTIFHYHDIKYLLMRHGIHADFVIDWARNGQFWAISYGSSWVKIYPAIGTHQLSFPLGHT